VPITKGASDFFLWEVSAVGGIADRTAGRRVLDRGMVDGGAVAWSPQMREAGGWAVMLRERVAGATSKPSREHTV